MTKDEALKFALKALNLVNIEFVCNGAHHAKKDRHGFDEDCPITKLYQDAITAIKEALANEALDKMAENARELGLDYEPQRTWVGLTDDEIKEIVGPWGDTPIKGYTRKLFDQIEAKLREKNHG